MVVSFLQFRLFVMSQIWSLTVTVVVDEKERKNGNDPEKELADSGFHDYRRPLVTFVLCAGFCIYIYVCYCCLLSLA